MCEEKEQVKGKGKDTGKVNPITGHEGPEGEKMYSFALSLTSGLDGVAGQRHAPAALPPGMTWYPTYRRPSRPEKSGFESNSSGQTFLFFPLFFS